MKDSLSRFQQAKRQSVRYTRTAACFVGRQISWANKSNPLKLEAIGDQEAGGIDAWPKDGE
jgi:hypothetical protein